MAFWAMTLYSLVGRYYVLEKKTTSIFRAEDKIKEKGS
jgi:hypothetical protein